MTNVKKVLVIGLDGLDPKVAEPLLAAGELPNLARLQKQGGYARLQTTYPAQTPVAWSTFATGTNPGGHGIFDFIRRDPKTYGVDLSFSRYEQKNSFLPPRAVNLRRGEPVWQTLSAAGVPSTIIRCPCTYPPDDLRGRMLAGMGVPDLRGSLGTGTFYTSADNVAARHAESVVNVKLDAHGVATTQLLGPRNPKTGAHYTFDFNLHVDSAAGNVELKCDGQPQQLTLRCGRWSDWLRVKFKTGVLQSVRGMVRFFLVRTGTVFELYASPINFDPDAPAFPISTPPEYARDLAAGIGLFHTTGMVEDHDGLTNGRIDEAAFLQHCALAMNERERMMLAELERFREGLFFCLFDTPDRLQHMFWRFREPDHPANHGVIPTVFTRAIEEHYRACDAIVGKALNYADDQTLFITLSDHGFNSFRRGINLNTWLYDQGLLTFKGDVVPGPETGDFFREVDWSRTKAYALGLSGIYVNLLGREGEGTVRENEAPALKMSIARNLAGLVDAEKGCVSVTSVLPREKVYSGPCVTEAPDLIVNCSGGYRVSWGTALGGAPQGQFEDNIKKWSGDHIVDPALVPGVLFMNRAFRTEQPRLTDLAPTILSALSVPKGPAMEGQSLLS